MAETAPEQSGSRSPEEMARMQTEQEPIILPPQATVYANNFGIGMTVFDLALIFGEAVGVQEGRTVIQQKVKILVSPLLAKMITRNIADVVAQYEKQFGEIKEPTDHVAFVEKAQPAPTAQSAPIPSSSGL